MKGIIEYISVKMASSRAKIILMTVFALLLTLAVVTVKMNGTSVAKEMVSFDLSLDKVTDMIDTYQQLKVITADESGRHIEAEAMYNKLNVFSYCSIGYLIFGGVALIISLLSFKGYGKFRIPKSLMFIIVLCIFHFQMYGMSLRWYITGNAPWNSLYDITVYAGWAVVCVGILLMRKNFLVFSLAAIFSGLIMCLLPIL